MEHEGAEEVTSDRSRSHAVASCSATMRMACPIATSIASASMRV
jgi:hypothetical protein